MLQIAERPVSKPQMSAARLGGGQSSAW